MPSAIASCGEWIETGRPLTYISPASGRYSPESMFIKVVFPEPFSPSSARISPLNTVRSMSWLATIEPKPFVSPFSSIAGCALGMLTLSSFKECFDYTGFSAP